MFIVFVVKPLLVIYMMSWALTDSVNSQLWLYKTCKVNFNYSGILKAFDQNSNYFHFPEESICKNLNAPENVDINDKVQKQVNDYQLYSRYMEVPQSFVSLFLGPLSGNTYTRFPHFQLNFWTIDKGRKPLMVFPFIGHIISGTLMLLNVYYEHWDARLLWLSNTYIFFGGYTLLSIAM